MRCALVLALAFLLSGCSGDGDGSDPGGRTPSGTPTATPTPGPGIAPMPVEVAQTVTVVGAYPVNAAFDPEGFTVAPGARVNVTLVNDDGAGLAPHDWVIDGVPGAATDAIGKGEEATASFTAPLAVGDYVYYCSIGDHRERGMEGTMTVAVA